MFEPYFFSSRKESVASYSAWMQECAEELLGSYPSEPYAGDGPASLARELAWEILPAAPVPIEELKRRIGTVIRKSIAVSHPRTAAHLHTPVLVPALGAEIILSALNQSMDSFDQAPAATVIEELMCSRLCRLSGLPESAAGAFTAGGTQSNYMGMLLARDQFLRTRWNWNAREQGLSPEAARLRIFCSEAAHFSVEKAAIQLGLGLQSVIRVAVDDRFRMRTGDLEHQIAAAQAAGLEPLAVVATAGTTDFGSFDPIYAIADIAKEASLWLHVDAAYGGALLLSEKHRSKLDGLERADSLSIDFHKAFFQPISCGAFLVSDKGRFDLIRVHADYLNTEERERDGIPDLVTRSVLTTRRFEALKLWTSFQALGRAEFGAMIDRLAELAQFAATEIANFEDFELLHWPEFGCVVFRYIGPDADARNRATPNNLFDSGRAVIGHTVVNGRPCLKLTFSNPCTSEGEIKDLLCLIASCATEEVLTAHA
jgi:L-2,4-diaminobutyrate decarboxylase